MCRISHTKYQLLFMGILFHFFGAAQEDTTIIKPELSRVEIIRNFETLILSTDITHGSPRYVISEDKMKSMGVTDVGSAMKFVPGVQIRDYGGIGGIKTISYRSLGSTHTALSIGDNIQLNAQSGTIDLSSFEIFGLSRIEFTCGQPKSIFSPATSYMPANAISLNSSVMEKPDSLKFGVYQNVTTINSYESGAFVRVPIGKKFFIGGQLMGRYGSGEYPFKFGYYGGTDETLTRMNSSLASLKQRYHIARKLGGSDLSVTVSLKNTEQELPGAVILYNQSNDQELKSNQYRFDINHKLKRTNWSLGLNFHHQQDYLRYFDPTFFNSQGFIESEYTQQNSGGGFIFHRFFNKRLFHLFGGTDLNHSSLTSNEINGFPKRNQINAVAGVSKWLGRIKVESNLAFQHIADNSVIQDSALNRTFTNLSPFVSFSALPFKKVRLRFRGFFKQTFRMPSFNDLYYNFIGNSGLKPEKAGLFDLGITYAVNLKDHLIEFNVDGFYSMVEDKIVAVPSKDLFNWSMQNIGIVKVWGADGGLSYAGKIRNWNFLFSLNATASYSVDVTDSASQTFLHQIPYTPFLASSGNLSLGWRGYMLVNNLVHTGERFSLNQNTPLNYMRPFVDWNLGIQKNFKIRKYNLFVSAQLMNLLNENYHVVRSFPMPGRHFQFTLKLNYR
ncbi:TonB-dependent receptor [Crocinitomix catalasitica]|nr:TonB-dependent receptor [Crocinitomix catalasitica]